MACICCPYGGLIFFPIFFALAASVLTFYTSFSCHMLETDGASPLGLERGVGLWTIQGAEALEFKGHVIQSLLNDPSLNITFDDDSAREFVQQSACLPWSQFMFNADGSQNAVFDMPMLVSRGLSMAATVLAVPLLLTVLFMACVSFRSKGGVTALAIILILEGLIIAASLVSHLTVYCSDADQCSLGYTSYICIAAGSSWVLAGLILSCMNKTPRTLREQPVAPEQCVMEREEKVATTTATRDVEQGQASVY